MGSRNLRSCLSAWGPNWRLGFNQAKTYSLKIAEVYAVRAEISIQNALSLLNNFNFNCVGLDFNENIIAFAKEKSRGYPNIKFQKVDVFLEESLIPNCDIAICTLFLHHFSNEQIEGLLKKLIQKVSIGVVINDLHRNKQAFNLFKLVSTLFLKTKTAKHDGLVSIARGFKKDELEKISRQIPNQKSKIQWRWAYRYQWILKKSL